MAEPAGAGGEAAMLRDLERRLEQATRTAERLLAEAAAQRTVPEAGWRAADDEPGEGWIGAEDAQRLLSVLAGLFERVPLELQQRVATALRELLLALRALLDWCLERAERRRSAPVEVQDIPIL